ncbi:cytochrome c oxidase subunit 2A [Aquibacillus halophilus]|uniref:Cytochrome c oxidase subunit 2A n=1 Tax=Aquibacillus halophilus TaxID=930132 RepID=A0A6A8DFC3_9BACI|nr:cytochrome c oxidase subunit 2A [Aquibacillus halophilus]MRH42549.1 cytochrome c oxidase subunit 2A [Aquibacillus halophilus]
METTKTLKTEKPEKYDEKSLKGTIVSVGFVAAVIVVMWVAVFWIYMERV